MVALMDPGNLRLPGTAPALLHDCVCTGAGGHPHPQRNLPLQEQRGAHPTHPGPAQPLWGSVGTAGWDSPRGGREADGFVLLPSCCGWVRGCSPPVSACRQLTLGAVGRVSVHSRPGFLPSLGVLAVPRSLGMSVCHGHCRCSAVSDPGMAAGTHKDSSDCFVSL